MPALKELLGVFVAGGAGATVRVWLSSVLDERSFRGPHIGTLLVNLIGCLAIGLVAATVPRGPWRVVVGGGLLGGFTTYSAFALLSFEAVSEGRWTALALQWSGHLVGGVLCVASGFWLGGWLVQSLGR